MYDICCVGHLTLDKIITTEGTTFLPGGTSYYFSMAMSRFDVSYILVTSLAQSDLYIVEGLRKSNIRVHANCSSATLHFENIYAEDQDSRRQRVTQKADPITVADMPEERAKIFHIGSLLAGDISLELIQHLAGRGKISLDVQGYLRTTEGEDVRATDWMQKEEVLPLIYFLKANEQEMQVITGTDDMYEGAKLLGRWGVQEVVITCGSKGSLIYTENKFYQIPAYIPASVVDATGCGDTYMAGYLFKRVSGCPVPQAGAFAAAMATWKIANSGPFAGTEADVSDILKRNRKTMTEFL